MGLKLSYVWVSKWNRFIFLIVSPFGDIPRKIYDSDIMKFKSTIRHVRAISYSIRFSLFILCFYFFLSFSLVLSSFLLLLPVECFFFCIRFILPLREILSFGICISASLDPTHSHKRVNIEHIINFHVNAIYRHKRKRWKQKKSTERKSVSLLVGLR